MRPLSARRRQLCVSPDVTTSAARLTKAESEKALPAWVWQSVQ
jgi:hypothetical protein